MRVANMMDPENGRVFLKSGWNGFGPNWPCVAFSEEKPARDMQETFKLGQDVIISVASTSGEVEEGLRSRLICAYTVDVSKILKTEDLVAAVYWERNPGRWPYCLPLIWVGNMVRLGGKDLPHAHAFAPEAYRTLGAGNRGRLALVSGEEREKILRLEITPAPMHTPSKPIVK